MEDRVACGAPPGEAYRRLNGYELISPLGSGSSCTVFLAIRSLTNQRVAIKVSPRDGNTRRTERFHREAKLCSRLSHPHIVQLLDTGEDEACLYSVFQYVSGETLRAYIARKGRLGAAEAAHLMTQVLDALDCAHRAGVVHRDLKPDNIMVARSGAQIHAMVLDFGIGTLLSTAESGGFPTLTMTSEFVGTPLYCAPEQLRGEPADTRSDLYAWGLMFLECLTGRPAVAGASQAEVIHRHLSAQELPMPPGIAGHPLGALLRRAMRKNPAERCPSAAVLHADLRRTRLDDLVGDFDGGAEPTSPALLRTLPSARAFVEKRQLTLVCCSVEVWPETQDNPDVELGELAQREELSVFADAAVRRGGTVAGTLGSQLLIVFGYPYASDTDVRRAGMTALDLVALSRQRAQALQQACGRRLSTCFGIHTGMSIVAAGEPPVGHVANIAMRLAAIAAPGRVFVSQHSAELLRAADARAFDCVDVEAEGAPSGLRVLALQSRVRTAVVAGEPSHRPSIGRDSEMQRLKAAWDLACKGCGTVCFVEGEPGIGKSFLVESLRADLQAAGQQTLRAHCLPEYGNIALAPILALMRERIADATASSDPAALADRLQLELESIGCDVKRVMPIFCAWLSWPLGAHPPSQLSPTQQRRVLLESIARWLCRRPGNAPIALVVEDLHWADPTTLELLETLAAAMRSERLLLVLTARRFTWVAPAGLPSHAFSLARLDNAHAAAIARQAFMPHDVDARVLDYVVSRTDGVPLFIRELAKTLALSHLVERDGVWTFPDDTRPATIPATLRDSLIARFDRLKSAHEALQLAATIGRRFEVELLRACMREPGTLDQSLDQLREAGLIAEEPESRRVLVFCHALIRDTAYECMLQTQREQRHGAVVHAMARLYPQRLLDEPDTAARHHAQAGQFAQAVTLGIRQLGITQRRSLNDETLTYGKRVAAWIDQLDAAQQSAARLEVNGFETQALMNKHGWAHEQVKERIGRSQALLAGPVAYDQEVSHLWSMITYHHVASNRAEVRRLSNRLSMLAQRRGDDDVAIAACTYAGLADYSDGRFDTAETKLSEAIDRYDPRRHARHAQWLGFDTRVWACAGRGLVRWFAGHEGAANDALQAVEWGRESGHVPSLCMALLYLSKGLLARGEVAATAAATDELMRIATRYDMPAFQGYGQIVRCWSSGEIAPADAALEALWDMGCRYCQSYYRAYPAYTLAAQGLLDQAVERIENAIALVDRLDEHMYSAELHLARARMLLQLDRRAPAIETARRAADLALTCGRFRTFAQAREFAASSAPGSDLSFLSPSEAKEGVLQ